MFREFAASIQPVDIVRRDCVRASDSEVSMKMLMLEMLLDFVYTPSLDDDDDDDDVIYIRVTKTQCAG
jgi:hypothetical protein